MKNSELIISEYLEIISQTRSVKTHKSYARALKTFTAIVQNDPLTTETYEKFLHQTSHMNPSTQAIHRSAIMGLYLYASKYINVNLAALEQAKRQFAQRQDYRPRAFNHDGIEKVISYCETLQSELIDLRDKAFVLVLADTGLRISEACELHSGDIDWNEGRATIGRGDKQAVVRFSDRSLMALKDYLAARNPLDVSSGKPLGSLPLFARHDKPAIKKVKPVKTGGMWHAIKEVIKKAGVDPTEVRIHDFRRYFVNVFYVGSGNLQATQGAARYASNTMMPHYAHLSSSEIDKIYDEVINKRGLSLH